MDPPVEGAISQVGPVLTVDGMSSESNWTLAEIDPYLGLDNSPKPRRG